MHRLSDGGRCGRNGVRERSLTAPTATQLELFTRYDLHAAFSADRTEDPAAGLRWDYRQDGLRPRLVLARWLARLGVLPMLTIQHCVRVATAAPPR